MRVIVIGAGLFGAVAALRLARDGINVTLIERLPNIVLGASANNQNRVHQGFHYPRSIQTARQSRDGFDDFTAEFRDAIRSDFTNAYFIASEGSRVSFKEFLAFCNDLALDYTKLDKSSFPMDVQQCSGGIICREAVYDFGRLRDILLERIAATPRIALILGSAVDGIADRGTSYDVAVGEDHLSGDLVINATYADINRLTQALGFAPADQQYEYTIVPIIELAGPPVGVTIMDGPFVTMLPYGFGSRFLLYHVEHSVLETRIAPQMERSWISDLASPFARMDRDDAFQRFRDSCGEFIPAVRGGRCVGWLRGPRMVLKNAASSDGRPSSLHRYGRGYFTVYAGKVDHCLGIADEIAAHVAQMVG